LLPAAGRYAVFFDGAIGSYYFRCPSAFQFRLTPARPDGFAETSCPTSSESLPIKDIQDGEQDRHPSSINAEVYLGELEVPWKYGALVVASWSTHIKVSFELRRLVLRYIAESSGGAPSGCD